MKGLGYTVAHLAAALGLEGMLRALHEIGEPIDEPAKEYKIARLTSWLTLTGVTPLHLALVSKRYNIAKYLLGLYISSLLILFIFFFVDNGASVVKQDSEANGCLHFLLCDDLAQGDEDKRLALLQQLLDSCDPSQSNRNGVSPIHVACIGGLTQCLAMLIAKVPNLGLYFVCCWFYFCFICCSPASLICLQI